MIKKIRAINSHSLTCYLFQLKEAVEDNEKELLEDIEAKAKKIEQLKRGLEDNEYLHQTKYDDLFLGFT